MSSLSHKLPSPASMVSSLVAFVLVLGAASAAYACPGCKEALASAEGPQGDLVRGFFWSILFMMSMPFTILGAFGIVIYRAMKKAQAAQVQPISPAPTNDREPVEV